jgi:hypothetical protein
MNPIQRQILSASIVVLTSLGIAFAFAEEPDVPSDPTDGQPKVTVAVARDRAALMHRIYGSTLEVMHERYFHNDRAIVPARALEDVFADVGRDSKIKARWIAVNTKAMSVTHEPKTDFEKRAAVEIGSGKESVETTEDGYYWRAGVIPLADGCVSCHTGFFKDPPKTPRYAALVIGVPVSGD